MYLIKTDQARAELSAGCRTLPQRERAALLMADGSKTAAELGVLLQGDEALIQGLISAGFLQVAQAAPREAGEVVEPPVAGHRADLFEGKRSLASTRMFLFDISERLFTRRLPDQALWYREQLREARDRDSMLAVARDMIAAVEALAGRERADSLSERLAMLLPVED